MRFKNSSLTDFGDGTVFFSCCLSWHFREELKLGSEYQDNYEVEDRLIKAGVVRADQCDSESCEFVAYFDSREEGEQFISRLNQYIQDKQQALAAVRAL